MSQFDDLAADQGQPPLDKLTPLPADALARRETLSEQLDAQNKYVAAEQKSLNIAMKSYQAGVGDYLSVLTAQRTLWSAQATLISLQQTDLENRITLWQSLGGGAS